MTTVPWNQHCCVFTDSSHTTTVVGTYIGLVAHHLPFSKEGLHRRRIILNSHSWCLKMPHCTLPPLTCNWIRAPDLTKTRPEHFMRISLQCTKQCIYIRVLSITFSYTFDTLTCISLHHIMGVGTHRYARSSRWPRIHFLFTFYYIYNLPYKDFIVSSHVATPGNGWTHYLTIIALTIGWLQWGTMPHHVVGRLRPLLYCEDMS